MAWHHARHGSLEGLIEHMSDMLSTSGSQMFVSCGPRLFNHLVMKASGQPKANASASRTVRRDENHGRMRLLRNEREMRNLGELHLKKLPSAT